MRQAWQLVSTIGLGLCLALAGCSEKPQTETRKADSKPWQNDQSAFLATGYKAGDAAAWERQIQQRAEGQNEYARTSAKP